MHPSQLRVLGALSGATLVMLGWFWWSGGPTSEADGLFPDFEPGQVRSLQLTRPTDVVTIERDESTWSVSSPYVGAADKDALYEVLSTLRNARLAKPVGVKAHADFGLAPPFATAVWTLKGGAERSLEIGAPTPVGNQTYVAMDGEVFVAPAGLSALVTKRAAEYRDHRVFSYDPADVVRVSIDSAQGRVEAKKTDGGWFLTGFSRVRLDPLDDWVTQLLYVRVDLFLDLDHETIEDPSYTIEVETGEGVQRLLVGRPTPYGPLVFFGEGLDGVVDQEMLKRVAPGLQDIGATFALPFDPEQVERVRISGSADGVMEPGPDGWSTKDLQAIAKPRFVYDRTPPVWGDVELTVTLEGEKPATIDVGPVLDGGFRAVRDRAGGDPIRVVASELAFLFDR